MISNTNKHFKWTKQSCNNYTVENLTEDDATIKITSETNLFSKEILLHPEAEAAIKIPSDGIYKVCLTGKEPDIYTTLNSTDNLPISRTYTVFALHPADDIQFSQVHFNNSIIYDSVTHGAATPLTPANLATRLDATVGAGQWELVPPNTASTLLPFLDTSSSWQLVLCSFFDQRGNLVIFTVPGGLVCFINNPTIMCQVEFTPEPLFQYITELQVDGINLLEGPTVPFQIRYDLNKVPSEQDLFDTHLIQWLELQGHTVVDHTGNVFTYTTCDEVCLQFENIRHENMTVTDGCDIEWCDFLYELCALYACVTEKVKDVLCLDCEPCKECDNNFNKQEVKQKHDLYQLTTLFFYGLVPLITEDRMQYLGDLTIDEGRLTKVMKIKDIYKKLVEFADRCGECLDEEDNPCGCKSC